MVVVDVLFVIIIFFFCFLFFLRASFAGRRAEVIGVHCVFIPFILDVRLVDVPAGVTQEEGHTAFLTHLPSAVLALIFPAGRVQPFKNLKKNRRDITSVYGGRYRGRIIMTKQKNKEEKNPSCAAK